MMTKTNPTPTQQGETLESPMSLDKSFCPKCGQMDGPRSLRTRHYSRGKLCDGTPITITYDRRAPVAGPRGDGALIALLLDWRKWYSEDLFSPWTIKEAQMVHAEFPGAVDRISADSARGTIDNIIADIREGKHREAAPADNDAEYECDGINCPPRAHDHKVLL